MSLPPSARWREDSVQCASGTNILSGSDPESSQKASERISPRLGLPLSLSLYIYNK